MRIALILLLLYLCTALAGCITTGTPVPIKIPVPVPCLSRDQLPKPPVAMADAELAKLDDGDLVLNLAADRIEYRRHSNEAGAVMEACIK